ncbi:MAG: alpha/beta hydrolase, partial [Dongiaceae bacterium]
MLVSAELAGALTVQAGSLDAHGHSATTCPASSASSVPRDCIFDLTLQNGDHQRVLFATPQHPRAALVMLPGGAGDVDIEEDGDLRHGYNFVVRTRALWVERGYAVLIPDALDHANLRGERSSPKYAALVEELVRFVHARTSSPVFLLGTSQGTIAAMNAAAHAEPGAIKGLILTESVSRMGASHETVFSADPEDIRVPALVVANRDDRCNVAPPDDAGRIAAAMKNSPDVRVQVVSGGVTKSQTPCGSLTPHGYDGI